MSLPAPDGTILWTRGLRRHPDDAARGPPSVDARGSAYFQPRKLFTKLSSAGEIVWGPAPPDVQYPLGHAAFSPATGRP